MSIDTVLQQFNFSDGRWLWALLLLPLIWGLYLLFKRDGLSAHEAKIKDFADPHLLPHLLGGYDGVSHSDNNKLSKYTSLVLWSLLWVCAVLAMAGPRWDYTEVKAYAPATNLMILMDMSRSMDLQDVKPSRLARARQEVEDITRLADGVNIGLMTYDSVVHMITPLTDDYRALEKILPSLTSDLVYADGANLSAALDKAMDVFSQQESAKNYVLIITDGLLDGDDASVYKTEKQMADNNVTVSVMAVGTSQGASAVDMAKLNTIAKDGHGIVVTADYTEADTRAILSLMNKDADATKQKTTQFWEERFYLFLIPVALLVLPYFRRGAAFFSLLMFLSVSMPQSAQAFDWKNLFLNSNQQGQVAIEQGQYDEAVTKFDDSYNRGVAEYKAGQYDEAMQSFAQSDREAVATDARYNLGNAQLMGGRIEDAIKSYEEVLSQNPDHADAAHNLEIAKKMLQQQQQQQDQNNQQQNSDDQDSEGNDQNSQDSQGDQSPDQQDQQDQKGQNQSNQEDAQQDGGQSDKSQSDGDGKQGDQDEQKQESSSDQSQQNESGDNGEQDQQQQPQNKQGAQQDQKADEKQEPQSSVRQSAAQNGDDQSDADDQSQAQNYQSQPSPMDVNADQWLNRMPDATGQFLKNKFYIETLRQQEQKGQSRW